MNKWWPFGHSEPTERPLDDAPVLRVGAVSDVATLRSWLALRDRLGGSAAIRMDRDGERDRLWVEVTVAACEPIRVLNQGATRVIRRGESVTAILSYIVTDTAIR